MDIRSMFVPVAAAFASAGTWTLTLTAHVLHYRKTAAADHPTLVIPLASEGANPNWRGRQIASVDIFYTITIDVMTMCAPAIYKDALPADGVAASSAILTTTASKAAGARAAVGNHTVTLTLSSPVLLEGGYQYHLEIGLQGTATGVFDYKGCRVNFT